MLARELVTILEETNPDYSRQSLLDEINFVQRMILGSANMYSISTDSATGKDPKITPDAEEYVIPDAMRIDRVYKYNFSLPEQVRIVDDTIFFRPEQVGQEYYVRYYKTMPPLTSESQELVIPDQYVDILETGVQERLSYKEHGSQEGWNFWKRRSMPRLQRKLNNNYKWGLSDGTQKIPSNYGTVRRTAYR